MSKLFERMFVRALGKLGAESTVLQRAAQKAARVQHDFSTQKLEPATEKAGIWLGAAAREVYLDIKAATAYLKDAGTEQSAAKQEELGKTSDARGGHKPDQQQPPFK